MNKVLLLVFLPLSVFLTGCETLYYGGNSRGQNNMAVREEMARQQVARNAEIARATAQSSEARLQQLDMRIARLESSINNRDDNLSSELVVLRNELAAVRSELAAESAKREKMREEIVTDLAGNIKKAVQTQQRQAPVVAPASVSSQSGYEHKVQSGQTLSAIALFYKVPVDKIRKANNLKGDMIRVGQVLFIPD